MRDWDELDWDEIVARNGPLVWRTAYRLVGSDADAAECFQEAFAAAHLIAGRETVKNWPALLQRLATVQALDRLRRRCRDRARAEPEICLDQLPSAAPEPSQAVQERELIVWLRGALAQLPESQAQAFSLICLSELSHREAAIEMNVATNHVAVLLHRARSRLRELLAAENPVDKS